MLDVVDEIRRANAGRDPERLALKYRAMRASPFSFMRGTCGVFHAQLPRGDDVFKGAPLAWVCGDLHLQNFGSYRADNGLSYFDLNDFDEASLAPVTWELVRLLASLSVGGAEFGLKRPRIAALCTSLLDAYATALSSGKAHWAERDTATGLIRSLLDAVRERKRAQFLDARTVLRGSKRRLRTDGVKALPVTAADRQRVVDFMLDFAAVQRDPSFFRLLDVARRIAGTGSLGLERYLLLVRGKGSPDGNHLLDLKIAPPSALVAAMGAKLQRAQPDWPDQAQRVAGVQRRMQAVSVAFLEPVTMAGKPFVLRALQPAQDRVDIARARPAELDGLVDAMGRITAWAQLRSSGRDGSAIADELIDFGGRTKWRAALRSAADDCAATVLRDAATFDAAYDDGAFER